MKVMHLEVESANHSQATLDTEELLEAILKSHASLPLDNISLEDKKIAEQWTERLFRKHNGGNMTARMPKDCDITVNGKNHHGQSVSAVNGVLFVDGKLAGDYPSKNIQKLNVTINGYTDSLTSNGGDIYAKSIQKAYGVGGNINCHGVCHTVDSTSGVVTVTGDIGGDVQTVDGNVKCCGQIYGNVSTISGDIIYKKCTK